MRYEIDKNTGFFVLGYGYGSSPTFSSLTVSGATTVGGQLTVNNNAAINGNLTVSGSFAAAGLSDSAARNARAPRQGLVFDGTAGTTWAGFTPSSSDFTVAAWFSANSLAANNVIIDGTGPSSGFAFYVATDGSIRRLNRNAGTTETTAAGLIVTGKRYHIAYVRGAFYLNGVSVLTFTDTQNYTAALTRIGWSAGNDSFCTGFLSVLIYNRALSASEVVALYEAGAPEGADYNSASNTSIVTSSFVNGNSGGAYLYDTYSGASATGFTAVKTQTTTEANAYSGNTFSVVKGQQFLVTFTCTLTSGTLPFLYLSDWAGSPLYNSASVITAGSFSRVITATQSGSGVRLRFYNPLADQVNYSISNLSITRLGLLLAPDAAQAGGGLTWYDTSGNAANITLPASGVSWNVPSSRYLGGSWTVSGNLAVNGTSGNTFNAGTIVTPTITSQVNQAFRIISTSTAEVQQGFLQTGNFGYYIQVGGSSSYPLMLQPAGSNVLVGTVIDSGNGKLQLAENTSRTAGIGFGTDIALYRAGGNTLKLELGVSAAALWFDNGGLGTGGARILGSSGALTITSNGANSLYLQTGGTTALTLDSSQRTFTASAAKIGSLTGTVDSRLHVYESTTVSDSNGLTLEQASTGDSLISFLLTGVQRWSVGIDNSDSDNFKIGTGNLGAADKLTITTAGDATFAGAATAQQLNALDAAANNRSAAIIRAQNNTTYSSSVLSVQGDRTTTNSSYNLILAQNAAVTGQFIVRDSGNVLNTNNSYGAISDRKLKENIVDTAPKLAQIAKIQIRDYNLIGKTETQTGVIAQELETVFPSLVESFIDRDAAGNDLGTVTKTVKYSQLVPLLVKALQELHIDFKTYKAAHP